MERKQKNKTKGNGEGSIYLNQKTGRYIGQYTVNYKRYSVYQKKNEKVGDFKKRFNEILSSMYNGTLVEKSKITFIEILENHVENKYNQNIISDRSYVRDKHTIETLKKSCSDICYIEIQKLTTRQIQSILPNITIYADSSINKIWRFINKAFKIALSDKLIQQNPMDNINISKPKSQILTREIEALTVEQHKTFKSICLSSNHKYSNILLLQINTGLRIGEVLALSKDCINFTEETIKIYRTLTRDKNDKIILGEKTKTYSGTRTLYMTPDTKRLILSILNTTNICNFENLIFYDYVKNTYVAPHEINSYLKRLNVKYNIAPNIHSHMLRHTFATRFIESGGSAKVLQKILGHKDISTTLNTYTSVFDKFEKSENDKYIEYMKQI